MSEKVCPRGSILSFQKRVGQWMLACFGDKISADRVERNHRFLEESLELVQSSGCTASEAHQLVDYVFSRAMGVLSQEVGGVMVTLAALCRANDIDMRDCGETELTRIWTKVDQIRAKQAAKPRCSPLPAQLPTPTAPMGDARPRLEIRATDGTNIEPYDGIACRDATIKLQDERIANLERENARLRTYTSMANVGLIEAQRDELGKLRAELAAAKA